ncbi:4'-phosphopantetheinyl transferase [Vibrio cyclitrophicus]
MPLIDIGTTEENRSLHYCCILFDSNYYDDSLFELLNVPFPAVLGSSVIKRRAEYVAARYAAQLILRKLGSAKNVGTAPDREPIWPLGFCGSISHTNDKVIALVSRQECNVSPGIDIEMLQPSAMRETADIFTTNEERLILKTCALHYEIALLITFSAKESLYKSLYPKVRNFFGFEAAKVSNINCMDKTITLELTRDLTSTYKKGAQFYGFYSLEDEMLMTLFV